MTKLKLNRVRQVFILARQASLHPFGAEFLSKQLRPSKLRTRIKKVTPTDFESVGHASACPLEEGNQNEQL